MTNSDLIFDENYTKLSEIARDYTFSWLHGANDLFETINPDVWKSTKNNPTKVLLKSSDEDLSKLFANSAFLENMNKVFNNLKHDLNRKRWFDKFTLPPRSILYLSPEYALHESFPNYAGGLGVLAGDHLKTAHDLGIPIVAVGLFYKNGYFNQHISKSFNQKDDYDNLNPKDYGLELIKNDLNQKLIIEIDLVTCKIFAQVWFTHVGNVKLFLLDTNFDGLNSEEFKQITDKLYGGDRERRIQQEILLGIGAIKLMKDLNIHIDALHINEGHAAFSILERIKNTMSDMKIDFKKSMELVKNTQIFTTHTPVIHGNEEFEIELVEKYLRNYVESLKLKWKDFLEIGRIGNADKSKFMMTVFSLKMCKYSNGVSKLHGETSRNMWFEIWKKKNIEELPIKHVTNGVHVPTWISKEFKDFYNENFTKDWELELGSGDFTKQMDKITNQQLWELRLKTKKDMVQKINGILKIHKPEYLKDFSILNEDALIIGLARRIAPYKRTNLIFNDLDKLKKVIAKSGKPIQIIISGKAHPKDVDGKAILKSVIRSIHDNGLEKNIIFIENYDIEIAKLLVKGCDVWLNNPIKPLEASGTSGMKSAINGGLNVSILDGWWAEAYNGKNGWAIDIDDIKDEQHQAREIYSLIDIELLSMYFDRINGLPSAWVDMVRNSICTITEEFSTIRMLKEYSEKFYFPTLSNKISL